MCRILGLDVFTGEEHEETVPTSRAMDVPNVKRADYRVVAVDGGFLSVQDGAGTARNDVEVPPGDLGNQIQSMRDDGQDAVVSVLTTMGEASVVAVQQVVL
jgi:translation initiation factor 5A